MGIAGTGHMMWPRLTYGIVTDVGGSQPFPVFHPYSGKQATRR